MQTHVKVLGVLQLIWGAFALLLGVGVFLGFNLLGAFVGASGEPDAAVGGTVLGLIGVVGSVVLFVSAALSLLCGWGLLTHKSWARILAIILCAISLIKVPFGTAFGIYGLWVLFNKETERLFATGGAPAGPAA